MKTKELDKLSNKDIILKYGKLLVVGAINKEQYDRIIAYCKARLVKQTSFVNKDLLKEVVEVFDNT